MHSPPSHNRLIQDPPILPLFGQNRRVDFVILNPMPKRPRIS